MANNRYLKVCAAFIIANIISACATDFPRLGVSQNNKSVENSCRFCGDEQAGILNSLSLQGKRYAFLPFGSTQPSGPYFVREVYCSGSIYINGRVVDPRETYVETKGNSYFNNLSSILGCGAEGSAKYIRLK
jgi:hypothetical protein